MKIQLPGSSSPNAPFYSLRRKRAQYTFPRAPDLGRRSSNSVLRHDLIFGWPNTWKCRIPPSMPRTWSSEDSIDKKTWAVQDGRVTLETEDVRTLDVNLHIVWHTIMLDRTGKANSLDGDLFHHSAQSPVRSAQTASVVPQMRCFRFYEGHTVHPYR